MRKALLALFAALPLAVSAAPSAVVKEEVDWSKFLGGLDPVWEQLPRQWNEGAFVGNGQLGMMVFASLADNRIDFHLGRADVTDHRKAPDRKTSMGVPGANVFFDFPRLDIGRIALRPAGKIRDGSLRIDLWNAEITGVVRTDRGELSIRALTVRDQMVNLVEVTSTEKDEAGSPLPWRWEFLPGNPDSPRALTNPDQAAKQGYISNPDPQITSEDGVPVCVQRLDAGGDYATAWLETRDGAKGLLWVSTANEVPLSGKSASVAAADVKNAAAVGVDAVVGAHRTWWHDYYPKTFLSVPDGLLQAFYWIQIYKLGSAWRENAPAIDLFGPWFRVSSWPGIWWNLNIQLTYWPVYAGNRLEIGKNYIDLVDSQFDTTFASGINGKTIGDFAWALHNYWLQLRFAGDWSAIEQKWVPKATRVVEAYKKRLEPNAAGRLELPGLGSPEFHGFAPFRNTNYNLGLLRWLLAALIEADAHASSPSPQSAEWAKLQSELVDFPVDANGLMIGSDQPLDESHRHFSHLLPLYPLFVMSPDDPTSRELLIRSVKHWHGIGGGEALAGYSFTGGAAIYAALGLGDDAVAMLHEFLANAKGRGKVLPNTMYVETGGRNPVIETPLSAASSITDLLIQSWGGKIRVFPAVPEAWQSACFRDLRAAGGFLVSASRKDGRTEWVAIHSEKGEPCLISVPGWSGALRSVGASAEANEVAAGTYQVRLGTGQSVVLVPAGHEIDPVVRPVSTGTNPFGVKLGRQLEGDQSWPVPPRKNSN